MVSFNVTVGGVALDALQEVNTGQEGSGTLGTARIICGNTQANRNVNYSEEAVVQRGGREVFRGPVTKKPSLGRTNERIEFTASDRRAELSYLEVHRPFYQADPGAIVRDSIQFQATPRNPRTAFLGGSTSGWTSTAPEFATVNADAESLQERGTDVLGVGLPEASSGAYRVTYDSLTSGVLPGDGQLLRYGTRMLVNSTGGQIKAEIEVTDTSGTSYNWLVDNLRPDFHVYELAAEDAVPTASVGSLNGSPGTIEYRFDVEGALSENRAIALDWGEVLAYEKNARSPDLSTSGVQDTGDSITRRFDGNTLAVMNTLAQEFSYSTYVENGVLNFEPSGSREAPVSIEYSSTPVVDANFNRDADGIVNRVTVQGGESRNGTGRVQVTAEDRTSIEFYGLAEREEQVVDRNIQTSEGARRRAEGFLADNAYDDVALSFTVADSQFLDATPGQRILVNWPPEDLSNVFFSVGSTEVLGDGTVKVSLTGGSI